MLRANVLRVNVLRVNVLKIGMLRVYVLKVCGKDLKVIFFISFEYSAKNISKMRCIYKAPNVINNTLSLLLSGSVWTRDQYRYGRRGIMSLGSYVGGRKAQLCRYIKPYGGVCREEEGSR